MITLKIDVRGTVIENAFESKCRAPGEPCQNSCYISGDGTTTCYKCNVLATCEGSLVHTGFQLTINQSMSLIASRHPQLIQYGYTLCFKNVVSNFFAVTSSTGN